MRQVSLVVNGQAVSLLVDPETPLLWVLREQLGLTGSKFGCGKGLCGACTVHIDGAATRSCILPVGLLEGRSITTIEGVGAGSLTTIQQAWVDENVPQCGYCQSGQIMSALALLAQNASPDDAAIDVAMSGNICRCGTYARIRKAIHRAANAGAGLGMDAMATDAMAGKGEAP
ncbi:MAG: (2Fe-2S)-binding protein [Gammaproteobacteria bacterium]|nr:MAG: (2Fe-2S)-binding protein [Gammaproteobacteria bacterium]